MLREGDLRIVREGKDALERRAREEAAKPDYRKLYKAQPFLLEGMKIIIHTDRLVWELIEDLIAVGVNALHPIDPTWTDIEEDKERVGDRPCIIRNISNELLGTGIPEGVTELTKNRLRRISPGSGYCLGAGSSVPDWAGIENNRAITETRLKCGRYPIDVD